MDERDNIIEDDGEEVILILEDEAEPAYTEDYSEEPAEDFEPYEEEELHGLGDDFTPLSSSDEEDDEEESAISRFFSGRGVMVAGILVAFLAIAAGMFILISRGGGAAKTEETFDITKLGNNVAALGNMSEEHIYEILAAQGERFTEIDEAVKDYNYKEADSENGITTVSVTLTTILKDLKIKFVNSKGKLIAKVPFEVEITGPDGKKTTWTDDDKDGVIYQSELAGGAYSVKLVQLSGYDSMYDFSAAGSQSVTVKTQLDYKKVDVTNEIKKSSQVDTAKEDTAAHDTTVESALKDTVQYVATAKVAEGGGFTQVDRASVSDPILGIIKQNEVSLPIFKVSNGGPVYTDDTVSSSGNDSSSNSGSGNSASGNSASGNNGSASGNDKKAATIAAELTIDNVTLTVQKEGEAEGLIHTATIVPKITITDPDATGATEVVAKRTYSSSDVKVATVDANGKVTAVGQGTATITFTTELTTGIKATATVTVTVGDLSGLKVALNYSTPKVVFIGGDTFSYTATVTGFIKDNKVKWYITEGKDVADINIDTGAITPKKEGRATVVAAASENQAVGATGTIVVLNHPKNDTTTKLKDNSGTQLYVKDASGNYVEATYANYYTGEALYVGSATSYKYTGWWNIDGKTYYFDVNGNKVTGDQVIQGAKYSFGSDGALKSGSALLGIDVSVYNGSIDWTRVKQSGVNYAIIRCGFRGSSVGGLVEDKNFATNIKNATAAGMKIGIYFFTQAITEAEAIEEASMCLSLVEGYRLDYPIFIDVESSGGRADALTNQSRTAIINAFCRTIANSGYKAGVYANKNWFTNKINAAELTGYTIWLAQYASQPTYTTTRYDLWQYSSTGKIDGISGNVDLNLSYLGY